MKSRISLEQSINKIIIAASTRMLKLLGEDELEIKNQGRFGYSTGFTQETGATDQQTPRIGVVRPKRRELSAGRTLNSDSTPHFLFFVFPWLDCRLLEGLFGQKNRLRPGRQARPSMASPPSLRDRHPWGGGLSPQTKTILLSEQTLENTYFTTKSRSRKWGIEQSSSSLSGGYR